MQKIFECVPNFSEGRNQETIQAIRNAVESINGSELINIHSDKDHNRSVFTIIGEEDALRESAFQSVKKATELIDLNKHKGTHPRIGAADVVPFIPLRNASMEDAISLARSAGKRIGEELQIPVFLYGEAAIIPFHRKLSNLRRGGFEKLRELIGTTPDYQPDFGPASLGPAGACAVGARFFLIAFNIYLNTSDIRIAKKIAREIRESSGGLPKVQALGMLVNNLAQVSMNLTDYRITPINTVYKAIEKSAAREGVAIDHSEIVGCVPKEAIQGIDPNSIKLKDFFLDRILENHLP